MSNNTGHDCSGKDWKWCQVRECLRDPCFWFAGLSAFLCSVPNGGITTYSGILYTTFGFSMFLDAFLQLIPPIHVNRSRRLTFVVANLQTILVDIPRSVLSVIYFLIIGLITSRWCNLRMYCMMFSVLPPLAGFLGMTLLPNEPRYKWTKWGLYVMTTPFVATLFLGWTLIPSNVSGKTKRTVTSSWVFIGYCVGNICGTQIFKAKEAPKFKSGTIGCAVCFGLEFFLIALWRLILAMRNKRRDRDRTGEIDGLTDDERQKKGKELGEQDYTDFENPYVSTL